MDSLALVTTLLEPIMTATFAPLTPLTATEVERGWVEYVCPSHGALVAMAPGAHVVCRCGKRAREERGGRIIDPKTNRPTSARSNVPAHSCSDCGQAFGGKDTLNRHRVGRGAKRRCLTPSEMEAKGLRLNASGKWSQPGPKTSLTPRAEDKTLAPGGASEAPGKVR